MVEKVASKTSLPVIDDKSQTKICHEYQHLFIF